MALCGAETWTLRAADQKYLESFEMWCWKRMEKISWTDHVRNEDVFFFSASQPIVGLCSQPFSGL
jgi:hypothetical protein